MPPLALPLPTPPPRSLGALCASAVDFSSFNFELSTSNRSVLSSLFSYRYALFPGTDKTYPLSNQSLAHSFPSHGGVVGSPFFHGSHFLVLSCAFLHRRISQLLFLQTLPHSFAKTPGWGGSTSPQSLNFHLKFRLLLLYPEPERSVTPWSSASASFASRVLYRDAPSSLRLACGRRFRQLRNRRLRPGRRDFASRRSLRNQMGPRCSSLTLRSAFATLFCLRKWCKPSEGIGPTSAWLKTNFLPALRIFPSGTTSWFSERSWLTMHRCAVA